MSIETDKILILECTTCFSSLSILKGMEYIQCPLCHDIFSTSETLASTNHYVKQRQYKPIKELKVPNKAYENFCRKFEGSFSGGRYDRGIGLYNEWSTLTPEEKIAYINN
eukprot:GAHX01001205.1.p1 GENE.GAHX01001205.1~~GAHX01001205.1.p1  ORF type:complete len:110 (-),score=9.48 GAHX01001205.1:11-340(-)